MAQRGEKIDATDLELKDTVVNISRVTKVVKGGKNLSFSALVVVGDGHGVVGFGIGKAKEVPSAIKKGIEAAKKNLVRVPLKGTTIPHPILGNFGAGSVLLKPAPEGTGELNGATVPGPSVPENRDLRPGSIHAADALSGIIDMGDAPSCSFCGSIMTRNGSCYRCGSCGSTSGCS